MPERLWWTLALLVPLAYNPVSRWQYEPDKAALTLGLLGLLLGVSLWRGEVRVRRTPATCIMAAFLVWRWLTLATSVLPEWSLWGDASWGNGLWLMLALLALFVLARGQLTTPDRRERMVTALLIGSVVIAGYGLLQYVGLDPLSPEARVRVPSTLAHANLLAAYLAMIMPFTLLRLLAHPHHISLWRRGGYGLLLLAQGLCLVFTYSRAGWLAASTGLSVAGVVWLWITGRRRLAVGLVIAGGFGILVLFGLSLIPPLPGTAPHVLQTLTSLFRWRGATAQIRLLGWQATLEAIAQHPWLGYGPATFRAVLPWFLPPELAPFGGANALGGRPHNVYLEMAVESGAPGLALWLALLAAVLFPMVQRLYGAASGEEDRGALLLTALLGGLIANLVTYGFSLESVTTGMLFWLFAGMAHGVLAPPAPRPVRSRRVLGTVIALGGMALAGWMAIPDTVAYVGEILAYEGMFPEAAAVLDRAAALSPTPGVFMGVQARAYADWALREEDAGLWAMGAQVHAARTSRWPGVTEYWQQEGEHARRQQAAAPALEAQALAEAAFSRALALSPTDPDLWLDRGLARTEAGAFEAALADFQQAAALLPGYTRYYGAMSVYAVASGDVAAAAEWQRRALDAQRAWDDWAWRR